MYFHGNRSHENIERNHQPQLVLLARQDALRARQRTLHHAHFVADSKIGMGFGVDPLLQSSAQSFDLGVRQRRWPAIETDQADHAREVQHPQAFWPRHTHENVTGK
jgi:hypothetical protein